jgi:hypothetical protein
VTSADPAGGALTRVDRTCALAHLRNRDTYTRLAYGFEVGVSTAWRYVREAVDLLAAAAGDLDTAMAKVRTLAYAILDGTLIPIDRVADQKPYYSGKHRRHAVNVQVIADAAGRLIWASAVLPGSGSRGTVCTPLKRHRCRPNSPAGRTPSTVPTPGSAPVANAPTPPSRSGKSWPSCAVAQAEQPRSCRPSSSYNPTYQR